MQAHSGKNDSSDMRVPGYLDFKGSKWEVNETALKGGM